jgi:uncharacterized protein (TIGR02001 family)
MHKSLAAIAFAAAAGTPALALAQAPAAAPQSPHTLTGNLGIYSSYRFRGIDQTFGKPALQGGIDYSHASGFYVGNWNSNVSEGAGFPGGNLEMDFYGGWKHAWGDWGLDVGAIYYYYPGTNSSATSFPVVANNNPPFTIHNGRVDNKEIYIGGSWKWISLKYSHAVDDYFSIPSTKNSHYFDLSGTYDLGDGWGVTGHVGYLKLKNFSNGSYTDWKIGVTKDISGWVFALAYVGTDTKGNCSGTFQSDPYCFPNDDGTKFKDAGRSTAVFSVSKTF